MTDKQYFSDRMEAITGTDRWKTALANSLGMHPGSIRNMFSNDANQHVPEYLCGILECLELLDGFWPLRFKPLSDLRRRHHK